MAIRGKHILKICLYISPSYASTQLTLATFQINPRRQVVVPPVRFHRQEGLPRAGRQRSLHRIRLGRLKNCCVFAKNMT